jgi:hypothetical protein
MHLEQFGFSPETADKFQTAKDIDETEVSLMLGDIIVQASDGYVSLLAAPLELDVPTRAVLLLLLLLVRIAGVGVCGGGVCVSAFGTGGWQLVR